VVELRVYACSYVCISLCSSLYLSQTLLMRSLIVSSCICTAYYHSILYGYVSATCLPIFCESAYLRTWLTMICTNSLQLIEPYWVDTTTIVLKQTVSSDCLAGIRVVVLMHLWSSAFLVVSSVVEPEALPTARREILLPHLTTLGHLRALISFTECL
jgi:hypothetical protein